MRDAPSGRLRILTWHVHGNYLYYLTQVPHDFYLVTGSVDGRRYPGRNGSLPWGDNVHEAPVERLAEMDFDVVLYQSRTAWEIERQELLSPAQRELPRIYLEHDPPQEHPTDTPHWVDDRNTLLVHVTHFNELMWKSNGTPTRVIEHGVKPLADATYSGEIERGIVVVNNMPRRGRRLGLDVYLRAAESVPLDLVGMGSEAIGGLGEVGNADLPRAMAAYRFFFNPIRYTSLGLAVIEAMMVGLPIVCLATTELVSVIRDGENGFIDTSPERLVDGMRLLLERPVLAQELGRNARELARERFGIERFVRDWQQAFASVS
jgi:glycosyltransferase involved in cell wall biosynthesis